MMTKTKVRTRPRKIPWISIFLVLAFAIATPAIQFPKISEFKKNFDVAEKRRKKPTVMTSKEKGSDLEVHLEWEKDTLTRVTYWQPKNYSDNQLADFANLYGKGGSWHEIQFAGAEKLRMQNEIPGLEQQWLLQGYGGETGWMGSGLVHKKFFIAFWKVPPETKTESPKTTLKLNENLYDKLKNSGTWLETKCSDPQKSIVCFTSILNSRIKLSLNTKKNAVEALIKENSPIPEIANTIKSLNKGEYHEYSRDLVGLSTSEGVGALMKFAGEIPELFSWTPAQIQQSKIGIIDKETYLDLLNEKKGKWDSIPIYQWETKNTSIVIDLHFNGHYQLTAK